MLSKPSSNFQTFRLAIYQRDKDTEKLFENGVQVDAYGNMLLVFDLVKLILYTIYFGQQNIADILFFVKYPNRIDGGKISAFLRNCLVNFLNLVNFIYFYNLSVKYNVNDILRENGFINSQALANDYVTA